MGRLTNLFDTWIVAIFATYGQLATHVRNQSIVLKKLKVLEAKSLLVFVVFKRDALSFRDAPETRNVKIKSVPRTDT